MKPDEYIDPQLTFPDLVVLRNLLQDVDNGKVSKRPSSHEVVTDEDFLQQAGDSGYESQEPLDYEVQTDSSAEPQLRNRSKYALPQQVPLKYDDQDTIDHLKALNDPKDAQFDPTVFVSWDLTDIKNRVFQEYILQPYIKWGKSIVRTETDIVMLTHLILYFITSVPSALFLFYRFSWTHGALHWLMQSWYVGTYTLMMHQHIHMSGILSPKYSWFDKLFPYITDPLMGHTWNSYFYHHVKHHHLEGNGPDDLSSTIRYQRDDLFHFLYYVGRFLFLVWFDLPLYFIGKGKAMTALKLAVSDMANYTCIYLLAAHVNFRATLFTLILPLTLLRLGLMVGNWGQHAFVDEAEPDSDFRSSITLIDVASNRFCYNDGYHTSHHLNPRRHWREHPVAFLKHKERYAREQALVFRNIDYIMLTVRLLRKDYPYLAKCLVPIGPQIGMSLDEIEAMLKTKTSASLRKISR